MIASRRSDCGALPLAGIEYKSHSNRASLNKNDKDNDKDNARYATDDSVPLCCSNGDLGDWYNGSYVRASCGVRVRVAP
jgi:hypothetical protein